MLTSIDLTWCQLKALFSTYLFSVLLLLSYNNPNVSLDFFTLNIFLGGGCPDNAEVPLGDSDSHCHHSLCTSWKWIPLCLGS